jgi:hypothetical protein
MYRIRFHLAAGKNFMKWQVKSPDGTVAFYEPSEVTLFMDGCTLKNQPNGAKKIFEGHNKFVVAWVEAVDVTVVVLPIKNVMSTSKKVSYNPAVAPNWVLDGENVDGTSHQKLFTSNRSVIKGK